MVMKDSLSFPQHASHTKKNKLNQGKYSWEEKDQAKIGLIRDSLCESDQFSFVFHT